MLVLDMIGLHMVFAYSRMGRVIVLKVETISSFCLPNLVCKCFKNVEDSFCFSSSKINVL